MKNYKIGLIIAGILTCQISFAKEKVYIPENLIEAVEKTVYNNPEIQEKFHRYRSSINEQNIAKGSYLPSADIVTTYRSQDRLTSNIGNTETPNNQTQLVLKQMLFDGFFTPSEVKRLGHAAKVRYYELQSSVQLIALETIKTYIDIYRYQKLLDYAKNNYAVHKMLFDKINERVSAGIARGVDLEQASGRLALAEANLLTEMTNLQNVTARYQRLTGDLPPDLVEEVRLDNFMFVENANDALKIAYRKNPELLSAIENIEASQNEIRANQSRYLPRLDMEARKNINVSSNGQNSTLAADTISLTATFNLFNGFSDKARIGQSNENLDRSLDLRDKACVDIRQTLVIAHNDVISLRDQVKYRNQHQLSIEKAREAYRSQFDIGQRTLLDLLDTENEYFQARRFYTNTKNDLSIAYARTYASQGNLLSLIGISRDDLPELAREDYVDDYSVCQFSAPEMIQIDKVQIVNDAPQLSDATLKMIQNKQDKIKKTNKNEQAEDQKIVINVQFESNSIQFDSNSIKLMDDAIKDIKKWGDVDIEVSGHTDRRSTSSEIYNLNLSENRAIAVKKYLVNAGYSESKIKTKGYGFSQPIAENDPAIGNVLNRRVEITRIK